MYRRLIAVLLLAVLTSGAGASPAAAAGPAPDVLAAARALLGQHPALGLAEAVRRINQGPARIKLLRQLADRYPDTYGGAWYDAPTGVQHLRATTTDAARGVAADSARAGITAAVHPADYSYRQLQTEAERINTGTDPIFGTAGAGRAYVDAQAGRTVVELPAAAARRSTVVGATPVIVRVASEPETRDACTSYTACGIPMRGGIALESSVVPCSVGYTATASDSSHWVLTAGHCGNIDTGFWHGEQNIGLMRQKALAPLDFGRVRISNSYWLSGSFGWLYNTSAPNSPVALNDYARAMSDIQLGEYVCLIARHSTSGSVCGPVRSLSAYQTGVGADACPGDSGGAWYLPGGGVRTAFGIHNSSDTGCHLSGGISHFSPVPTVHRYMDDNSAATIRIDTR